MWHFLVILTGVGQTLFLSRDALRIYDGLNTRWLTFRAALTDISVPDLGEDDGGVSITVTTAAVPTQELRNAGILLGDARAEVSMWKEGTDLKERVLLLVGGVASEEIRRYPEETQLELVDDTGQLLRPFPPWSFQRGSEKFDQSLWEQFYYGFSDIPDSEIGKSMNVIIGTVKDVPLTLVNKQGEFTQDGLDASEAGGIIVPSSLTAFRWVLAGHPVYSTNVVLKPDGENARRITKDVLTDHDPITGAEYSYIIINATDGLVVGASSLVAESVDGHVDQKGFVIRGLGDAIMFLLKVYSGLSENQIDYDRLARFVPKANRISFSGVFGGSSATWFETIKGRLEEQFPVRFSFRGGRFGADWLLFDDADPGMKRLINGVNLIDRIDPVTFNNEFGPEAQFSVEFDPNAYGTKRPGTPTFRRERSWEREKGAYNRWAELDLPIELSQNFGAIWRTPPYQHPPLELIDVNDEATADLIVEGLYQMYGILRTQVQYVADIDNVIHLPLREKYWITDDDMGWTDEPFRLDRIKLQEDGLAQVTLVSYNEAP